MSARSASGLNKDKRDGGQRQQDPSDTEDSYQPEVELDVGAAGYCALKAALTVRANRDQSDSQACFNSLPYGRGRAYTPTPTIPLPGVGTLVLATLNAPALAACGPPDVALEVERLAPGLLVYRICWPCLLAVVTLEAFVAAVIAAIIILGPVLIPAVGPALIPVLM